MKISPEKAREILFKIDEAIRTNSGSLKIDGYSWFELTSSIDLMKREGYLDVGFVVGDFMSGQPYIKLTGYPPDIITHKGRKLLNNSA